MNDRLERVFNHPILNHPWTLRVLTIAISITLVSGVAMIGPVGSRGDDPGNTDGAFVVDDGPTPDATGDLSPGATPSLSGSATPVAPGQGSTPGFTIPGGGKPSIPPSEIPSFGLRTQGITADAVKIGISYNVASCGDAAVLEAMLGPASAGDLEKSINTFARYINDTGGLGGKKYKPVIVDDGGSGCPEKNIAAAITMAEQEKVFMAIPGLHIESDYIMKNYKIPVFGGREDPDSLKRYGPNGLQILEPTEPTFEAWASFGRYYLKGQDHKPCLIRIENGAAGDFDTAERILKEKMSKYGLTFADRIWVFKDDVSTAQQQSNSIAAAAKGKGCDQVYYLAGNPIGLIFFTDAATQNGWFPTWTFTSMVILTDDDAIASLMDPVQWENAIGLSYRVPAGQHRDEGKCKDIYEQYNGNDGQSDSAAVKLACATILPTAEMMRRAIKLTGTLTADTLLLGANAIDNDFFYDATVPLDWRYPSVKGPFKTRGFSHYTVVDWSSSQKKYTFPLYPCYYQVFKANDGGCEKLTKYYKK